MSARLRFSRTLLMVLCALFVLLQLLYVNAVGADVAYMDTLRYLGYYDAVEHGSLSFWETWNQGEHRGLIFQTILGLNADFFSLDVLGANRLSALVIGATVLLLGGATLRSVERTALPRPKQWALGIFAALVCVTAGFGLAGFELLVLDLGLSLFLKNLLFILFWLGFDGLLRGRWALPAMPWLVAAFGVVIVLAVAMGWSYAFVLAALAMAAMAALQRARDGSGWDRFPWQVAVALVLAQGAYVWLGGGITSGAHPDEPLPVGALVTSFLLALSSTFVGTEVGTWLDLPRSAELLLGSMLLLGCAAIFLRRLTGKQSGTSLVPYALIAYGLLCAVAVAVSRGRHDVELAKASRYFMDYGLILVGLVWACIDLLPARELKYRLAHWPLAIAASLGTLFLGGQSLTTAMEWKKAPYRAAYFDQMRSITLSGNVDDAGASVLQSPLPAARDGVRVQRERGLGLFRATAHAPGCSLKTLQVLEGWYAQEETGRWVAGQADALLSGCGTSVVITLYAPGNFTRKSITVAVDGKVLQEQSVGPNQSVKVQVPMSGNSTPHRLSLKIDPVSEPADGAEDVRPLGLLITDISSF